ncbi:MAG TPA: helix-turn-helix transcriptional regulator [Gemmatimonadaceae bacterium]
MARFRVDELLRARGMSQSDLARASGVSLFTVHAIANNRTVQVRLDTLEKLARALGVEPGELISSDRKRGKGK